MYPKYEEDVYGWAIANAALLKQGKMNEVDVDHIIEELEALGRSEKSQLVNRLSQLIFHLLKWQYQPDFRGRSWKGSINEQRKKIKRLIYENPSLKPKTLIAVEEGFDDSKSIIEKETPIDLKLLPSKCPYTFEQLMDDEFYPD